jgi:hypothetical protein
MEDAPQLSAGIFTGSGMQNKTDVVWFKNASTVNQDKTVTHCSSLRQDTDATSDGF